jgi:predicted metal-dependent phosphoesterase TrpH
LRLKLDLHVHSLHSRDCTTTIEEIFGSCIAQGLDGFALTDHDSMKGLPEAVERRGELVVVPGLEVSARGAHILALDSRGPIPPGLDIQKTVELIHEHGATAVLAHPYGLPRSWVNMDEAKKSKFDAIEVANSAQFPYDYITMKNRKLAERLGLPETGGSDSHIPETVGRAYTIVEAESRGVEDVVRAIREGRTEAWGSGITIGERLRKIRRTIFR